MQTLPFEALKQIVQYLEASAIARLFGTGNPQLVTIFRTQPILGALQSPLTPLGFPSVFRHFSKLTSLALTSTGSGVPKRTSPVIDLYPSSLTSLKLTTWADDVYDFVPYGLSSLESLELVRTGPAMLSDDNMDKFWNDLKTFPRLTKLSAYGRAISVEYIKCLPSGLLSFGFSPLYPIARVEEAVLALPRTLTALKLDLATVTKKKDWPHLRAAILHLPPSLTDFQAWDFLGNDVTLTDLANLPRGLQSLDLAEYISENDKLGLLSALPPALTKLRVQNSTRTFDGESKLPSTLREMVLRRADHEKVFSTLQISALPRLTRLELEHEIPIPTQALPPSLTFIILSTHWSENHEALYQHRPFEHLSHLRRLHFLPSSTIDAHVVEHLPLSLTELVLKVDSVSVDAILPLARFQVLSRFVVPKLTGILLDHHIAALPHSLTDLDLRNMIDPSPLCLTVEGWYSFPPRLTRLFLSHALPPNGNYKPPSHLRHLVHYHVDYIQ